MIPPGHSIAAQLARYEEEMRSILHDALASESTRIKAEQEIASSLAAKQLELEAQSQFFGTIPVRW